MNEENTALFVDMGYNQCKKHGEMICGDAVAFRRFPEEERFIAVLSDGLGSGVKANILASMTTTMAMKFIASDQDILHSAEIIMDALPICQVRKISYATFTIVDTTVDGKTRVIEMGNPEFILLRNGERVDIPCRQLDSPKWENRTMSIYEFEVRPNDRLIFCSDGISQAGVGSDRFPLGWRVKGCLKYIRERVEAIPEISSHELARNIVREAIAKEPKLVSGDDMTCCVINFRHPRKMMLFTGPPFDRERDAECAEMMKNFNGTKVICGGTSAEIMSRELGKPLEMDLKTVGHELPPISKMEGVDLITEGIFTLTKTAQYLEKRSDANLHDPAGQLTNILLGCDMIEFVVGTRINEAHQDPNLPVDLEIRRNIVKRISEVLKNKYVKDVNIKFV